MVAPYINMSSKKFDVLALANTFAIVDIILHPLFRIWISISPSSYENAMNLFVAGLQIKVTSFDLNLSHMIFGTILEATIFWLFGAAIALIYNKLSK